LIFRAYYAFFTNTMTNSRGMPTSTIFGFTLALEEVLRKEHPTHIAVVFDPPGPTFRHQMFPEYKANREATPEDIKTAVPYIKKMLEGFNIPVIEESGFRLPVQEICRWTVYGNKGYRNQGYEATWPAFRAFDQQRTSWC